MQGHGSGSGPIQGGSGPGSGSGPFQGESGPDSDYYNLKIYQNYIFFFFIISNGSNAIESTKKRFLNWNMILKGALKYLPRLREDAKTVPF